MPPNRGGFTVDENRILDLVERMKFPKVVAKGAKRPWTVQQKAQLVAAYDAMPRMGDGRGYFARHYHLYWGMINRWRKELKETGTPVPDLLQDTALMNGATPVKSKPARKPGPKKRGSFQSVDDTIAWLRIREEETRKIREELEEHAGKTRNE